VLFYKSLTSVNRGLDKSYVGSGTSRFKQAACLL